MNVFFLSLHPVTAAQYHCNEHVISQLKENAQIISTVLHGKGYKDTPIYKPTHRLHPMVIWASKSYLHLRYIKLLSYALSIEHKKWKGNNATHKSHLLIRDLNWPYIKEKLVINRGFEMPPFCGGSFKPSKQATNVVAKYKEYYKYKYSQMKMTWSEDRPVPYFMKSLT